MAEPDWINWAFGGFAALIFVGGLLMMFTTILTDRNR